jgi:hypothetical protein
MNLILILNEQTEKFSCLPVLGWQSTVVETSNNPIKLTETYKSYHTTDGAGTSLITSHQASETITVTPTKMSAGSTNWLSLFVLALSFLCYILL